MFSLFTLNAKKNTTNFADFIIKIVDFQNFQTLNLTIIGYKRTDTQIDKQKTYIDRRGWKQTHS